jgi:hypothetical protein
MRWLALLALLFAGCGQAAVAQKPHGPKKVDDYPLYELTDTRPTPKLYARLDTSGWACTVFMSANGTPMLGRNFDFHDEPALVLHHRPPGAYKSVSLVDISYLGVDRRHLDRIDDPGQLDGASRLPFDGMNEKGVAVGMAAVPHARTKSGRTIGSLGVMRQVLDRAASVDEAVAIFARASIDFDGGPPLHYLVADATGAGAVIEYVGGQVYVIRRGTKPYLAMTNFILSEHEPADHRYRTAQATLERANGTMTPASTIALLRATKQPITRWSAAYDLKARRLTIVMGQRYGGRELTFAV